MSWKEEYEDCCGTCGFHRKQDGEWVCNNKDSDAYGCETGYGDGPCECYKNRRSGREREYEDERRCFER